MKLEDLHSEWATDALIDATELDRVSGEIPRLHAKYVRYLSAERMVFKKLETEVAETVFAKTEWLAGRMPKEEMDSRGWKPEGRRVVGNDVDRHLSVDREVVDLKLRLALQKEKVDLIESIVKMIMNRNFVVKNMIDWIKFKSGA